ncbi:MAG: chromosome segregation protein SMC [Gemmatimonadota bacterium]|nr:chromosome segregation protein SMC [Gemmatimonadota bacterium]
MYLSRLTALGFKSFVQQLDLSLQKGITCVVGPNGCGKSNVVDALRWALGEQRVRSLRSNNMEDVIFSGTRNRKPLGMAEVSITVDNTERILPVDYTEVTVTRRLFRSGDSDYLLNKVPCRLKDIQNLLMDTGLGAHAYSVIEQGMMDEIISDRPEERRRLFEEAAGVTRYKMQRRAAWNRLASVRQDLQTVDAVMVEVERQVKSLARQERKARLYIQLSDRMKDLEVRLGRQRFFQMSERSRPVANETAVLKEDVEVAAGDIARLEARLEDVRTELSERDRALREANAEVSRQSQLVHRKDTHIQVAQERIRSIDAFLKQADLRQEDMARRRATARKETAEAQRLEAEARGALQQAESALAAERGELEGMNRALDARRNRADEQKSQLISALGELSEGSGRLERGRARLEGITQRQARLEADAKQSALRKEEADAASRAAKARIDRLERDAADRKRLRETDGATFGRLLEQQKEMTEERSRLLARREADDARIGLLKKFREGFEGYSSGVRALAVESPFADRVRGVVADRIEVDGRYAAAVEAALGRALECLLVDETADVLKAIDYLQSGDLGSAAFLPLDSLSNGNGGTWTAPDAEGVAGRASNLLRGKTSPVHALLQRTLVVKNAGNALPLLEEMRSLGVDVVTENGELFSADGTIYGGETNEDGTGLIGRRQEIETLEASLSAAGADLQSLDTRLEETSASLVAMQARIDETDGILADLNNRLVASRRDLQIAREEEQRQLRLEVDLRDEIAAVTSEETGLREAIASEAAELNVLEKRRERLEAATGEADAALREQERQQRAGQDAFSSRQVEIASLAAGVDRHEHEGQRWTRDLTETEREMKRLASDCEERRKERLGLERAAQDSGKELETLHRRQDELESKRDAQAERQQALLTDTRQLEEEVRDRNRRANQNRDRLGQLQAEMAELRTGAEALRARILDEYEVDVREAGALDDPEFNADVTEAQRDELRERIRRMGPVNPGAVEEYEEQKKHHEFMSKHRSDLIEAAETLQRTISRIDRTARGRFMVTFDQIKQNFRKTFEAFFDGGQADLLMSPDEDPLEAPLEIIARPKGKRLQHINLLSGGERALTAIALLFAIYLVKPSPFCILDEVDAPLDDANVTRFVRVLKRFAADTQFIVVTHNKVTMDAADCLHGITMEEPGVSRLVSVRLDHETQGGNGQAEAVAATTAADD